MRLTRLKTRYISSITDTPWLDIGQNITFFIDHNIGVVPHFFKVIESINPCSTSSFAFNYPKFIKKRNYQKRTQPSKATSGYGIFAGDVDLARRLGKIDQSLYELDRIEVGRRLDSSRWLSFVEISQSARWSDIKKSLNKVHSHLPRDIQQEFPLPVLKETDRLLGDVGDSVIQYIETLGATISDMEKSPLQKILFIARKEQRFQKAIDTTFSELPCFQSVALDDLEGVLENEDTSRSSILLIDGTQAEEVADNELVRNHLKNLGQATQVLYGINSKEQLSFFEDIGGYRYEFLATDDNPVEIKRCN